MLHINDADQPAIPADENKKQGQEELEPLPWEIRKGFLWGLTRSFWIIFKNPVKQLAGNPSLTVKGAISYYYCFSFAKILLFWALTEFTSINSNGIWYKPYIGLPEAPLPFVVSIFIAVPVYMIKYHLIPFIIFFIICTIILRHIDLERTIITACYAYIISIVYFIPYIGYIIEELTWSILIVLVCAHKNAIPKKWMIPLTLIIPVCNEALTWLY